mgnify:CR=1 FL=1
MIKDDGYLGFETWWDMASILGVEAAKKQMINWQPTLESYPQDKVYAYINHGRWLADCIYCKTGAEVVFKDDPWFVCFHCFNQIVGGKRIQVKFPNKWNQIEKALENLPENQQNWNIGDLIP